jgi:flagellar basal-body rod protein FlgB
MFFDRLMNETNAPLLERVIEFTAARHKFIAENIANVSTPGYRQKDLSVDKFFAMLRARAQARDSSPPGSVSFADIDEQLAHPNTGILFHDGNNRSMEQTVSDLAKNALMHNVAIELLRKQYATLDMALKEKVG